MATNIEINRGTPTPVNRKPKFVEIPSIPATTENDSLNASPNLRVVGECDSDAPDPTLMAKLGLYMGEQRVSHVKTTNHPHPMLSHGNIGANIHSNEILPSNEASNVSDVITAIHNNENKKKQTTSPASTLSDKGIGSSVGSFDSEFRVGLSVFLPSPAPYDASRSGSLDSRTQDLSSYSSEVAQIPNHSRSSSDIICHSSVSSSNMGGIPQSKLAEQSSATMWNSDPRRGNPGPVTTTSSIKPRRPSTRRQTSSSGGERSTERDSLDIKKLPQLCQNSPSHSSRSSVSSSRSVTPAVSVCEMSNKSSLKSIKSNGYSNEPLPPPPPPPPVDIIIEKEDLPPPPPPPEDLDEEMLPPPPLPPKTLLLRVDDPQPHYQEPTPTNSLPPPLSSPCVDTFTPDYEAYTSTNGREDMATPSDEITTASSTLTRRLRLSSDGAINPARGGHPEQRGRQDKKTWAQDQRREIPVTITHNNHAPLSSTMSAAALGNAESFGNVHSGKKINKSKPAYGSTNALWEQQMQRPHAQSSPVPLNPHRLTPQAPGFNDDTFSRHSIGRSSTRSNPSDRNVELGDPKAVRFAPFRAPDVNLQPLMFELPLAVANESKFVGREWLFSEILAALNNGNAENKNKKGVVISGESGHGKTSIIDHLVSYSYHGHKNSKQCGTMRSNDGDTLQRIGSLFRSSSPVSSGRQYYHPRGGSNQLSVTSSNHSSRTASPALGSTANSRASSQTSLNVDDSCRKLASQVVAFHFCQSNNNTTCYVPEFLNSIAAQLSQAPQLTAYRELLINEPHLQNLLSVRSCIQNPSQALKKAIIEPLVMLKKCQKLPRTNLVILIDAINEAEKYRPDYGFSILSFLERHLIEFPDFIKVVVTCRTQESEQLARFPVHFVSIDADNGHVARDVTMYIGNRIANAPALANLNLSGKCDPAVTQKQLTQHLLKLAKGNFLYLRMTLDLIEKGSIVPKSSGFKIVPMSIHEVFLLMCNLRFMSYTSFDEVRDIISVALASLYPLKDDQIYQAICSGLPPNQLPWPKFKQQMELLDDVLVQGMINQGRSFFHPCFREWLVEQAAALQKNGTLQSSSKFRIDVKRGYALLATVLSRQPAERLHKHATLELAHHVLKAGMFKNKSKQTGIGASEQNARFMAQSSKQLTEALTSIRNLFFPNMKVSKLLLKAGANPNVPTQVFYNATPLSVVSHTGCTELAELLLMFGADVNLPASNGMSALTFGAAAGRRHIVDLLLKYGPNLNQVDMNGHTPLLHAISRGHSDVAKLLLTCDLYASEEYRTFAAQQALVASATTGDVELMRYLIEHHGFNCNVNALEPSHGESPLTSAAAHGKTEVCDFLVGSYSADVEKRNKSGLTPLLCAVKHGHWDTADLLLNCGASLDAFDPAGKTALITAACNGHLGVLELLLSRGSSVVTADREGLTALSWAALQGHGPCARSLLSRNSEVNHCDASGRTALDLAAFFGDPQIVDLLLDAGADFTHVDSSGMCALDRAIGCQNISVVARLLKRGAEIAQSAWTMASGKPDVTAALLNKCLEDGNAYYKNFDFKNASGVYWKALKHVGEVPASRSDRPIPVGKLADLCAHLLLGYSRCLRKMGDLQEAEDTATRAIELKPHWYEALYARARVLREASRLREALSDVMEAEKTAPAHNLKEIKRLIERIKDEIRKASTRHRPSSASSEMIHIPQARPRLNSSSSYHGNMSRGTSPAPSHPDDHARSYRAQSYRGGGHVRSNSHQLAPLYGSNPNGGLLKRGNSQDSMGESMLSLAAFPPEPSPLVPRRAPQNPNNKARKALPRTNPHWRPQVSDLNRSISDDRSYNSNNSNGYYGEQPSYDVTMPNGRLSMLQDPSRASFVTDL